MALHGDEVYFPAGHDAVHAAHTASLVAPQAIWYCPDGQVGFEHGTQAPPDW